MPTCPVKAREIKSRGKTLWRVIIPKEIRGEQRARFFESKNAADTYAKSLEQMRREAGSELLTYNRAHQGVLLRALSKLENNPDVLEKAVDYYLTHKPRSEKNIRSAIEEMIDEKENRGLRDRYIGSLRSSLLNRFSVGRGERYVSDIKTDELAQWIYQNSLAQSTRRGLLIDIRTFFSWAMKKGYCGKNPAEGIEPPVLEDKPPAILTVEEATRLLNTARAIQSEKELIGKFPRRSVPKLVPYFALALFAGVRPEELMKMTWEHVCLEEKYVIVPAAVSKTRQRRLVQLSDNCIEWLKLGGDISSLNHRRKYAKVRLAAGFEEWNNDCMRHSFASYHLAKHKSAEFTATEMGHSNTNMLFRHYREIVKPSDADRFWSIHPE